MRWAVSIVTLIAIAGIGIIALHSKNFMQLFGTSPMTRVHSVQEPLPDTVGSDLLTAESSQPLITEPAYRTDTQETQESERTGNRPVTLNTSTPLDRRIDPEPLYDRTSMEKAFFDEVNHQRRITGLKRLAWRDDLASSARRHSRDQATDSQKIIDRGDLLTSAPIRHEGTTYATLVDRLRNKEIADFSRAGENILSIALVKELVIADDTQKTIIRKTWKTPQEVVDEGVRGWMLSQGHRENILTKSFTHAGVGIVRVGDFLIVTEHFIAEASCGYRNGPCCTDDDVRSCFENLTCATDDTDYDEGTCRKEEDA